MKKHFYSLFAAATMLLAVTSCSQEEDFVPQNDSVMRFSIQLDGTSQSRIAGDGKTVDQLFYAVYDDATNTRVYPADAEYKTEVIKGGKWTLELPLMKSEKYDILFWAQKGITNDAYTFTNLKEISINYQNLLSNKEEYDAFFNALDGFTASGGEHTIVLRRPFAQLNVATTEEDWKKAETIYNNNSTSNVASPVTASSVTVSDMATKFNVLTGEASDPKKVTFKADELIGESITLNRMVDGQKKDVKYILLAMNYILPDGYNQAPNGIGEYKKEDEPKSNVDVEFTLFKGNNEEIVKVEVPSTPIQRNWRTNIIGDLLTGEGFDVIVDGEFDNTENEEIEIKAEGIVKKEDGFYHITKTEGLWALANLVNNGSQDATSGARAAAVGYTFKGETFVLDCDINLNGEEWTPMDNFAGTFDGNGKKISNFKVNKAVSAGLFGNLGTGATIKNLTVTDATVLSTHWAGVIAGRGLCVNFIGCTVENSSVTVDPTVKDAKGDYNGDKAGSIIGYISGEPNALIEKCSAKDVTIQAYRDLGGIVGYASGYENGPAVIKGNKVENIVLVIDNTNPYKEDYNSQEDHDAGAIVGEVGKNANLENDNTSVEGTVTTIYTASEGYLGYYKDTEGNYCVTEDKGIEAVMDINEAKIKVILKNDVEVNVTSWQTMAFGGDQTTEISINGENNKLTFKLNDSDWSNVTTANNAKLILNDLEIASSGYNSGNWKRNGVCFNCPVEMNNVVSEAILLEQNATLNNVEINEASGAYSIWIWANGQTVDIDGLTINAGTNDSRAIAIKDEDAKTEKVTLNVSNATIASEKKAAILVTSTAGANITLNNVDITKVVADKVAAVWVDEDRADYFNEVTVTGGKKALENSGYYVEDGKYYAPTNEGLKSLIDKGEKNINLAAGEYTLPNLAGKEGITIIGEEGAVIGGNNASTGFGSNFGKNTTIKNITFSGTTNGVRYSYANGGSTTFDNCTFAGESTYGFHIDQSNSATFTFNNCTFSGFNAFAGDLEKVIFNSCTFKHNGYYGHTNIWSVAYFNNCTWEDKASVSTRGDNAHLYFNDKEESYHHEFIGSAESLFAFAKSVNDENDSWRNQTVILVNDIDLRNQVWTPIGQTGATEFKGTFDGQNHTIKNLTIDSSSETGGDYSSGLFGWAESGITIKNLKVDGASVTGNHNVAVIVGYTYSGIINNCHVTNANIVCNHANNDACGDKCGLIAGYAGDESRFTKCSGEKSTVKAGRDAGQLIGCGYEVSVSECSATDDVEVSVTGECTGANVNKAIIGRIMG